MTLQNEKWYTELQSTLAKYKLALFIVGFFFLVNISKLFISKVWTWHNNSDYEIVFAEPKVRKNLDLDLTRMFLLEFLIEHPELAKTTHTETLLRQIEKKEIERKKYHLAILEREISRLEEFQTRKFDLRSNKKLKNMQAALSNWNTIYCQKKYQYQDSASVEIIADYRLALQRFRENIFPQLRGEFSNVLQKTLTYDSKVDVDYICTEKERILILTSDEFQLHKDHESLKRYLKLLPRLKSFHFEKLRFKNCIDNCVTNLEVEISNIKDNEICCEKCNGNDKSKEATIVEKQDVAILHQR